MDTDAPTPTPTEALLILAQWLSPAFPVGAFAYSHGLETQVADGQITCAATFGDWLGEVLTFGAGRNDAILLAAAFRGDQDAAPLALATAPSTERRLETLAQGTAFATTADAIWQTDGAPTPYPIAVGHAARSMGLPLKDTLVLYLHAFAANLTSAAIRIVPLGQTEGQAELAKAGRICGVLASQALHASLDDLGGCCFLSDIASMRHETLDSRVFRS